MQPLPEIPPHKPKSADSKPPTPPTEENTDSSSTSGTKVALRTEEEQQAAAREREERERLEAEKEANSRREARRKSLANRRVSFAAEATLHTFHVEYLQDSTTSTDSTRRASSVAGQQQSPSSDPPEEVEEEQELPSDKRRRRSSGIPPLNFNNPEDDTLSSTIYSSDSEHTDADGVAEIHGEELSDSDSEVEDGTMMTVDADEMTSASVASAVSARSGESDSTNLDENLRLAARMAATQRLEEDDEEEEIIGFAGWVKKPNSQPKEDETANMQDATQQSPEKQDDDGSEMDMDESMDVDMEITHAVGGILKSDTQAPEQEDGEDMDMSMDVTRALGGIISHNKPTARRRSVRPPPQEPEEVEDEDVPMDITTAVGGIRPSRTSDGSDTIDDNEDMSMELTTAVGSVIPLPSNGTSPKQSRRRSVAPRRNNPVDEDGAMDETVAVGRILSSAPVQTEDDGDDATMTMGMDMTTAIGGIIKTPAQPQDRSTARKAMEAEADEPGIDAIASVGMKSRPKPKQRLSVAADENGSPGMGIFRGKGLRRTPARDASINVHDGSKTLVNTPANVATPSPSRSDVNSTPKQASPSKTTPSKTTIPSKAPTPAVASPSRTPPSKMIGSRSTSPRRRQSPTISTPKSASKPNPRPSLSSSLFRQDPATGATTPRVILSPKRRRLSGVGIDRPGLGSPRMAELLDRRESIGESASSFSPAPVSEFLRKGVSFADPREMQEELDRERREEEERENKRKILEREADGDVTANLREMIQSLSPKKLAPMRGRKSLHVGSARGVLGKRPAELDEDDDEDDGGSVKRLKMDSPVKKIHLAGPPSKAETTTGRRTRAAAKMEGADKENVTPSLSSPVKVSSPSAKGRFRDVDDEPTNTFNLEQPQPMGEREQMDGDEDRIHLQDFLNMTSIRFMELTTTKRRHTVAPAPQRESGAAEDGDVSLEKRVVAGACTSPMLDLYQHVSLSCPNFRSDRLLTRFAVMQRAEEIHLGRSSHHARNRGNRVRREPAAIPGVHLGPARAEVHHRQPAQERQDARPAAEQSHVVRVADEAPRGHEGGFQEDRRRHDDRRRAAAGDGGDDCFYCA
jgi:kinetochore protein Spc7/SPC105